QMQFEHPPDLGATAFAASIMSGDLPYRRRVSAAIAAMIGTRVDELLCDYRIAFCNYAVKDAGLDGGTVELHQDWTFVDESRHESIGVWCPLIDVDPENGCLHVVAGSQRFRRGPRGLFNTLPVIREDLLRPLPLKAGEAVLFSPRLFHTSPPNRSRATRIAACAVLVPSQSRLWYVHAVGEGDFEIFEVDDDFYLRHTIAARPEDLAPIARIEHHAGRIDLDDLPGPF
ncbi:MAG TPA: phytanoyl-CoA dioxygenase family protein, partial [Thermoanaerobaculia bacterium]|nr:phytanoyl-CoA dioxygenase family protein [Thermoanaerobaculia bacterium]